MIIKLGLLERSKIIDLVNLVQSVAKEAISNLDINGFIKELEGRLNGMSEEKEYTIDRFENDYAVCENRDTKEMINIPKKDLPEGIKEGSILKLKDGKYSINVDKEKEISERIKDKMDRLWNN